MTKYSVWKYTQSELEFFALFGEKAIASADEFAFHKHHRNSIIAVLCRLALSNPLSLGSLTVDPFVLDGLTV